jgi:hypothetical protein
VSKKRRGNEYPLALCPYQPYLVRCIHVCSIGCQQLDNRGVTIVTGQYQRRLLVLIANPDVRLDEGAMIAYNLVTEANAIGITAAILHALPQRPLL